MKAKKIKPPALLTYGDFTHHLKSPLASIFSMVMILKRQSKKQGTEFEELEKKLQVLNKRIDQVTQYIRVQQEESVLYSFFPLSLLIGEAVARLSLEDAARVRIAKLPQVELLGDMEMLAFALSAVLKNCLRHKTGRVHIHALKNAKNVQIFFRVTARKEKESLPESLVESSLLASIAEGVMRLHGGGIENVEGEKIILSLPRKAKKRAATIL